MGNPFFILSQSLGIRLPERKTKSVSFDNCYKSIDGILSISIYFTSLNYIPIRYIFVLSFPRPIFWVGRRETTIIIIIINNLLATMT